MRRLAACQPVSPYLALLYSQTQDIDADKSLAGWSDIDAEITALFQRGQQAGEFRPDLTAAWLTEAFYSLVAGAAWAIRIGRVAGRDFTHMITDLLLHESSVMTRNWLALGVLTLAVLLIGVDGTVLALATPFISRDLGDCHPDPVDRRHLLVRVGRPAGEHGQPRRPHRT